MPDPLTIDEVRHVARLARLRLTDAQLEEYRTQLSSVLGYIQMLQTVDVAGVEPMAHPLDVTNRLANDDVGPSLPVEAALANAPATEGRYYAVPKIIGEDAGSSA